MFEFVNEAEIFGGFHLANDFRVRVERNRFLSSRADFLTAQMLVVVMDLGG